MASGTVYSFETGHEIEPREHLKNICAALVKQASGLGEGVACHHCGKCGKRKQGAVPSGYEWIGSIVK